MVKLKQFIRSANTILIYMQNPNIGFDCFPNVDGKFVNAC